MILRRSILAFLFYLLLVNFDLSLTQSNFGFEPRGFAQNIDTKINVLAKFGNPYTFQPVMLSGETPNFWVLSRNDADNTRIDTTILYYYKIKPRNQSLIDEYSCKPSEDNCGQLSIPSLSTKNLGYYSFRVDTPDLLVTKNFLYNVSAYKSIDLECQNGSDGSSCFYNQSTQTLSVVVDRPTKIICSVPIIQNDNLPISAQINFNSEYNGEECSDRTSFIRTLTSPLNVPKENYNVLYKQLTKNCTRVFRMQEAGSSYTCQMNPTKPSGLENSLYQMNLTYQSLVVKIDLQYGPDPTQPLDNIPQFLTNKTIITGLGSQASFSCPFVGNPTPNFYWRVVYVQIDNNTNLLSNNRRILTPTNQSFLSSQDYTIPRDLEVGNYVFECKAQILGLINQFSQPVLFNLRVDPQPKPPVTTNINVNNPTNNGLDQGAIIGIIIGCIVFLILVIIGVLIALRYLRNRKNPKDDLEKAKENKKRTKPGNIKTRKFDINNRKAEDDEFGFKVDIGPVIVKPIQLPVSSSNSSYRIEGFNENSSLANNKIQINNMNPILTHSQLPILSISSNYQTPPTLKKRPNEEMTGSQLNLAESSSSSLNNKDTDSTDNMRKTPNTYKNLNDYTTSAHEFFEQTKVSLNSSGSTRVNSPTNANSTVNYGVYSPSNAEARRLDVPSIPIDSSSNRSYSTRQLIQPIHNNINNNNAALAQLGIPTGGIKVLPTNTIKLINQNPLESPPPYDAALQQPIKKESPNQQQRTQLNQMNNSNSRLLSATNTPTQQKHGMTSLSYTSNTPQAPQTLSLINTTPTVSASMQQLQYQQQQQQFNSQANLQYTSVHSIENRARSRNPLNAMPNDLEHQHQQTQYTTLAAQLSSNPIDV